MQQDFFLKIKSFYIYFVIKTFFKLQQLLVLIRKLFSTYKLVVKLFTKNVNFLFYSNPVMYNFV